MKPLLTILALILLAIPECSQAQERRVLSKCIDTYRSQYIRSCVFPTDSEKMKKAVASYMFLNHFSYNSQTDSSVTFSRPISYGGVRINIPWEQRWFYQKFRMIPKFYTGVVTVNVGIKETIDGLDFEVISYVRKRNDTIYDQCDMPYIEPELREYIFGWLGFEVPYWPEELGNAVDQYNQKQIYPDRRLRLN